MAQAQGVKAYLALQRESAFATDPTTPDLKKIYFTGESLNRSIELIGSETLRGNRNSVAPVRGNTDVGGGISFNLGCYPGEVLLGVMGSCKTALTGTGETVGSDIAATAATIDASAQTMTVTKATHGLSVGDLIQIAGLTAPTALNSTYAPILSKTTNDFVLPVPAGVSGAVTIGSGTFKKVTAVGTGYSHILDVGGVLPYYTIEKGYADIAQYIKYQGCKFARLGLTATPSGFQSASVDILGAKATASGTSFDSTPTDLGCVEFDGFRISDIEEGGSNIAGVTEVTLQIDNGLDGDTFTIGGAGQRGSVNTGLSKVTGTIRGIFEDLTLYNKGVNQTESSLKLVYSIGTGVGTAGNEYLEFFCPEVLYSAGDPPVAGPKGIVYSLNFEGYYANSSEATSLRVTLKNTQSSLWG
jgi:hypothetical protein